MIDIKIDAIKLPDILDDKGNKTFLQTVRRAENRAIGAARKEAAKEIRSFYGLKARGSKYGPQSPYARPAINEVIETKLVRSVEGVKRGIPALLMSETKRLSAVRFTAKAPKAIRLKGVKVKRRENTKLRIGKRQKMYSGLFVQKGRDNTRLHVFRSRKKGSRWVMDRVTITPVSAVLSRSEVQTAMSVHAEKVFKEKLIQQLQK